MAGRGGKRKKEAGDAPPALADKPDGPLPLPSPVATTNLVIADLVLRAAGGLLRDRMEKGLLKANYDPARAEKLVDNRSLLTSAVLWGASRMARRSPVGLAVIAGSLAVKVFYDRGKQIEKGQALPPQRASEPDKR